MRNVAWPTVAASMICTLISGNLDPLHGYHHKLDRYEGERPAYCPGGAK